MSSKPANRLNKREQMIRDLSFMHVQMCEMRRQIRRANEQGKLARATRISKDYEEWYEGFKMLRNVSHRTGMNITRQEIIQWHTV